ncbi:hypothetical protein LL946_04785 [Knoellia locipacati]|uniref:hypothetical protein n=1 Tax=Knoellia locipacati TaxID=882824 RepID=UPI0038516DB4
MDTSTNTDDTAEDTARVDPESIALRMAINNHAVIDSDIGSPYQEGRRDAYLLMAVALEAPREPTLSRTITQLRQALHGGVTEVDDLREIITRSTGRSPTPKPSLEWVGPKAFDARHSDWGLDEDFGMRWGTNRDIRISFKRQPGATEGLLYAYDKTWDTYAVIADKTNRTLVQLAYRQALAANPDMTAENFAHIHQIVTAAGQTAALAPAVSL